MMGIHAPYSRLTNYCKLPRRFMFVTVADFGRLVRGHVVDLNPGQTSNIFHGWSMLMYWDDDQWETIYHPWEWCTLV